MSAADDALRRRDAVVRTRDRFLTKAFDWSKAATCIHLIRYHAAQMGHDVPVVPRFRTARGALKALKQTGFETLPDMLDDKFEAIPPAFMRVGDVMSVEGIEGLPALVIKADRHKFLGWHEADLSACQFMEVDVSAHLGAWRL